MNCPDCQGELKGNGNKYQCQECETLWQIDFTCDVCGSTPSLLSSCGSVSFFCDSCKSMKSRSSMEKKYTKL